MNHFQCQYDQELLRKLIRLLMKLIINMFAVPQYTQRKLVAHVCDTPCENGPSKIARHAAINVG